MAIEASKFTEKDELISRFYTLRAGLSVISEETEKIKQAEQHLSILNGKNTDHNKAVQDNLISERKSLQENIAQLEHPSQNNPTASYLIQQRIYGLEKKISEIEKRKAPVSTTIILSAIAIVAVFWTISGLTFDLLWESNFGLALNYMLLPAGPILALIVGSKLRKNASNKQKETMQAPVQEKIRQEEIELKKAKALEERAIATLRSEISALELAAKNKMDIYMGEIDTFKAKFATEIIPTCTSVAQSVKKAMLETSMGIITETDWANIDLLIFYLETGRADSLKEALQLVDKQRQTDQIAYAIHEASNHIVNTLGERLNKLGGIIQAGFTGLAKQIQFNHNEAMSTMQHSFSSLEYSINVGNQEMSEKLSNIQASIKAEGERLANVEQLNASLLKKANESSDNLMYELRYNQKYWRK